MSRSTFIPKSSSRHGPSSHRKTCFESGKDPRAPRRLTSRQLLDLVGPLKNSIVPYNTGFATGFNCGWSRDIRSSGGHWLNLHMPMSSVTVSCYGRISLLSQCIAILYFRVDSYTGQTAVSMQYSVGEGFR